ncbi:hypothetical protein BT96DRAFT_1059202 [Gymnopus androsaceus JB14]|uniref:Uncharacterized protein n=1 Tax=Gymnopus androsaceus JB14 TaxID=1447944 RepID=A0A6A4GA85_9AGAR|nr:hypothetical protein BT96DRAFT_1059202 [Gymnopus androsaceus JB14]
MWTGRRPWSGQEVFPVLMKLYGGKQPPPIPAELLLSEDAMDFRNKCFFTPPLLLRYFLVSTLPAIAHQLFLLLPFLDSPGPPIVYTTPPSSLARLNLQFLPDDSISSSSTSSSSLRSGQKRSFHVGNLDSPSPWQKKFIDLPPGAPDFNLHLAQSMSTLSEFFPDHDIDKAIVTEAVGASLPSTFGERSGSLKPKKSIRMVTEQRARRSQRQSSRATKLWGSHLEELGGPKS